MCEHDSFWCARGATGEEESCQVSCNWLFKWLLAHIWEVENVVVFKALLFKADLKKVVPVFANSIEALAVNKDGLNFNEINEMLDLGI